MWLITSHGFYSAVEDRNDTEMLWVRARAPEHAYDLALLLASARAGQPTTSLAEAAQTVPSQQVEAMVIKNKRADYAFRLHCSKEELSELLAQQVLSINYDNFKNMLHHRRGAKDRLLAACHDVWQTMRDHLQR